jgi:hypothetical protein
LEEKHINAYMETKKVLIIIIIIILPTSNNNDSNILRSKKQIKYWSAAKHNATTVSRSSKHVVGFTKTQNAVRISH